MIQTVVTKMTCALRRHNQKPRACTEMPWEQTTRQQVTGLTNNDRREKTDENNLNRAIICTMGTENKLYTSYGIEREVMLNNWKEDYFYTTF